MLVLRIALVLVLAMPASGLAGRAAESGSNNTWDVFDKDPTRPGATLLGKAQHVCVNQRQAFPCLNESVTLEHDGVSWRANREQLTEGDLISRTLQLSWIWAPGTNPKKSPADLVEIYLYRTVTLFAVPRKGTFALAADDLAEVTLNGVRIGSRGSIKDPDTAEEAQHAFVFFDIKPALHSGDNTIVIRAQNGPAKFNRTPCGPCSYAQNPAGVLFAFRIETRPCAKSAECDDHNRDTKDMCHGGICKHERAPEKTAGAGGPSAGPISAGN